MREFIDIVNENWSEQPSFSAAVTDELVSEIITSGHWVEHGSELADWWEQNAQDFKFDYKLTDQQIASLAMPWDEVKNEPFVKMIVTDKLIKSAEQHDQRLKLTGETWIYRAVFLPAGTNFDVKHPLGRFWTTDKNQANRFAFGDGTPASDSKSVLIMTQLKNCDVNWRETIRSRLDQFHGMDEEEIQLNVGSKIIAHAKEFKVATDTRGNNKLVYNRTVFVNSDNYFEATV